MAFVTAGNAPCHQRPRMLAQDRVLVQRSSDREFVRRHPVNNRVFTGTIGEANNRLVLVAKVALVAAADDLRVKFRPLFASRTLGTFV